MLDVKFDRHEGFVTLTPRGKLAAEDFAKLAAQVDPWISAHGSLRGLLIVAEGFPGWSDFAAFVSHIRFVRDHHRLIRRVAAVSDSGFLEVMPAFAKHFVHAEIRHFRSDQQDEAIAWLRSSRATEAGRGE
jgi:tRNA U38,U39,U40 pseudouridine synthase TruA